MVGILVALRSEINLNNQVSDMRSYIIDGFNCYTFNLLNKQVVLIYSGVGKANAAAATNILINHFKVNLILNIGFCGCLNNKDKIGHFFVPRFLSYCDVDATSFGYEMNQIPHEQKQYEVKNAWVNDLQKWIHLFNHNVFSGSLGCGDSFIDKKNINKFNITKDFDAVDMESCAIAQICSKTDTDCLFIKLVSDCIDSPKSSESQWDEAIKTFSNQLTETLINVCYQIIYSKN